MRTLPGQHSKTLVVEREGGVVSGWLGQNNWVKATCLLCWFATGDDVAQGGHAF